MDRDGMLGAIYATGKDLVYIIYTLGMILAMAILFIVCFIIELAGEI
jgi:hypothetical protein